MALFGVGYAGMSLFLSGLLWSHSLVQLPAGLILDKLGVYRGFLIAIIIALVSNLLPFLAPENLALATALRFFGGLSSGVLFLAGVKVTAMMAPPEKIAQAQGIQGAAFSLGTMLPFVTLPYLGNEAWRFSYLIPATLSLVVIALSLLLPASVRKNNAGNSNSLANLLNALKFVATSVPIWTLGMFHGLSYGTLNNLGQWLPSILADLHGQSTALGWSLATGAVLLLGTLARAYGSVLAALVYTQLDHQHSRHVDRHLLHRSGIDRECLRRTGRRYRTGAVRWFQLRLHLQPDRPDCLPGLCRHGGRFHEHDRQHRQCHADPDSGNGQGIYRELFYGSLCNGDFCVTGLGMREENY